MNHTYPIEIAGLKRELTLYPVSDTVSIAAFIMFGDVEITKTCAAELLKLAPEHDIMITAECKGVPLLYEMARQENASNYIVARKAEKVYMTDVITARVDSITTAAEQTLYLGGEDAALLRGKRILIVDDVVSTGESLAALEQLVALAGGKIVGKMCVLAEGDAIGREDLTYLQKLPLFHSDGTVMEA